MVPKDGVGVQVPVGQVPVGGAETIRMDGELSVQGVQVRTALVPLSPPLQSASGTVSAAPMVLIDLRAEGGIVGRSYLFCFTPLVLGPLARLVVNIVEALAGTPLAPIQMHQWMRDHFRLLRPQGLVTMAAAGVDMAAWDAWGHTTQTSLARLLGGTPGPVPAYASLRSMKPADIVEEAGARRAQGFTTFKVKLGMDDLDADVRALQALRDVVGPAAEIAVDYNQSLTVAEAIRRINRLSAVGHLQPLWVEEPTDADDDRGHAHLRSRVGVPIQLGESWWGVGEVAAAADAGACDLVMLDLMRVGGVTGWMHAAGVAAGHRLPLSSHLFPEISAHLLAVSPNAYLLEYFDLADPLLDTSVQVHGGSVMAPDTPGAGISWDEPTVAELISDSGAAGEILESSG